MDGVRVLRYHNIRARCFYASLLGCLPHLYEGRSYFRARSLKNIASMSNFRTFRDFFHFNKEVVCLIVLGYIALIFIIIVLSMTISEQNRTINLLQNGIIRKQTTQYINKPRVKKLLENEYRMFTNINHR